MTPHFLLMNLFLIIFFTSSTTLLGGVQASEDHPHHLRSSSSDEHDPTIKQYQSGSMGFEKGIKCGVSFDGDKEQKYGREGFGCGGGMNYHFKMGTATEDVSREVTEDLTDELRELVVSHMEELVSPSTESMKSMVNMEEAVIRGNHKYHDDGVSMDLTDEDNLSATLQFGGMMNVSWGCNFTVAMEDGKLSKDVSCGFSLQGGQGIGPKPTNPTTLEANDVGEDIVTY